MNRLLFRGTLFFQTSEGVSSISVEGQPFDVWIMARELCVFEKFDLSLVPASKRESALGKQLKALSPFKEHAYFVEWNRGWAAVWIWDKKMQKDQISNTPAASETRIFPESSLTKREGQNYFACKGLEGYFMQLWNEGAMVADVSWASKPGIEEQRWFFESNGQKFPGEELTWASPVYDFSIAKEFLRQKDLLARILVTVMLLFSLGLVSYQIVGFGRASFELSSLASEIRILKEEKKEIVSLRSQAMAETEYSSRILALAKVRQSDLMLTFADALEEESNNLIEWQYENGQIEALLANTKNSPDSIVRRLENTGMFGGITLDIDSARNRLRVSAELINEV